MKKTKEEFNLGEIVAIFLPKIWIVVAVALVFALVVGGYLSFFKFGTFLVIISSNTFLMPFCLFSVLGSLNMLESLMLS